MPDHRPFDDTLRVADALRALPLEVPARTALPELLAAQRSRRAAPRRYWGVAGLATAAMLGLAVWLPINPAPAPPATTNYGADMVALQDESARLEALLATAASDPLRPADAVMVGLDFEDSLRGIDLALSQDDLDDAAREALWRKRVAVLSDYASLETSRRWLASEGQSYQTTLVSTF